MSQLWLESGTERDRQALQCHSSGWILEQNETGKSCSVTALAGYWNRTRQARAAVSQLWLDTGTERDRPALQCHSSGLRVEQSETGKRCSVTALAGYWNRTRQARAAASQLWLDTGTERHRQAMQCHSSGWRQIDIYIYILNCMICYFTKELGLL